MVKHMLHILGSVARSRRGRLAAIIGMTTLDLVLTACGQKGPLYLPDRDAPAPVEHARPEQTPTPTPAPAPAPDSPQPPRDSDTAPLSR